ncbi:MULTISPECIES: Gfo/Idh/MocA family oxidoreductase [Paenibacillus]|uniref:Gfo/Idh/MocA family protein n=1 Tax=Paenibacillus TaxID=44249 RepID=UPI002FE2750C
MNEALGAAIIGCGTIFPLHAEALRQMDGAMLRVVIDEDRSQAEAAAGEFGCEAATRYRELLDRNDIQVVHLCTPHHLHAEMAVELLRAGKHVLSEKPMAHNLEAALQISQAAERSNAQFGVMFQNRYNESSQIIRNFIDTGELGNLVCMKGIVTWSRNASYYSNSTWRGRWETEGGGVLINQAIHTLDLLQWFGGEVSSIRGCASADFLHEVIEVEDTVHAALTFKNGTRCLFYATNAYSVNSSVELELIFERGSLHQHRNRLILNQGGQESLLCGPPFLSGETGTAAGKSYWGYSHGRLISDFYNHIREGRKFWIDEREGLKTMRLLSDLYASPQIRRP